jgi:hypothetical protein
MAKDGYWSASRAMKRAIQLQEDGFVPRNEPMEHRLGMTEDSFAPIHLSRSTPPPILRSILASARQVTCLALDCLENSLVRFRALRPQHLIDEEFKFRGSNKGPDSKRCGRGSIDLKANPTMYEMSDRLLGLESSALSEPASTYRCFMIFGKPRIRC